MGFHEQAGDADCHGGPRQYRHELALAAGRRTLPARQLHGVGGIEDDRASSFAHDGQAAHVGNQVVVAEAGTALANHDVVGAAIYLAGLGDDILHVARRQELAFLDIHRLAAGSDGMDEIGLPAQEGRGLQHVDHRSNRLDLVDVMHIGQHGHANLALHFAENPQAFVQPQAAHRGAGTAVGLVVGSLEDVVDAEARTDFLHRAGHIEAQLLGFSRARAGDQEKRLVKTSLETAKFHYFLPCLLASAAFT